MLFPSKDYGFALDPFFEREDRGMMKTDITERENEFELNIELPGFKKEDIQIELEDGSLKINAVNERKNDETKDGKIVRRERFYGSMSRSFEVGDNVTEEDITATFENGVLKLIVPKKEEVKAPKKYIEIQ